MGANSLSLPPVVVLCFLLIVSSSHAVCLDDCIKSVTEGSSPSAEAIAQVVGCTTKCSLGEQGELKATEELISLDQNLPKCKDNLCFLTCRLAPWLCAERCNCSLLASFANDHDQEMMKELISLEKKLMAKRKYNVCYRACHALGGSKAYCAQKCKDSLLTLSTFELDRKVKMAEEEADDEASSAASA